MGCSDFRYSSRQQSRTGSHKGLGTVPEVPAAAGSTSPELGQLGLRAGVARTGGMADGTKANGEEIFVVSGLGAQQQGLCATLTRGWLVDRRMEM